MGQAGLISWIPWISAEQMNHISLLWLVNAGSLTCGCRNGASHGPLSEVGLSPGFRKSAEPIRVLCSISTLLNKIMLSNSCPLTHFYLILYFLTHWQHVTNNSQVIPVEALFFISINKYIQSGIIVSFIWETKIYCFSFLVI